MVLIWFIHNLIIFQEIFFSIALFAKVLDLPLANSKKKRRCLQVSLISKLIINYVAVKYTCFAAKGKISKDVCLDGENSTFLVFSKSCLDLGSISTLKKIFSSDSRPPGPRSSSSYHFITVCPGQDSGKGWLIEGKQWRLIDWMK